MPEPKNGRIGGGVLKDNLEIYQGGTPGGRDYLNFANLQTDIDSGNPLLHLNAKDEQIGVNTDSISFDLQTSNNIGSSNIIAPTTSIANLFDIASNRIDYLVGSDLLLSSAVDIEATAISTNNLLLDYNTISTYSPNSNIELRPNTGFVNIRSHWNNTGSIHATGNIEFGGNFTLGDSDQDNVVFEAEVASDILPDTTDNVSLGSPSKRFDKIYSRALDTRSLTSERVVLSGARLELRQGNIFYVSTLGDNTNVGDHQHGAFRTIKHALDVVDASSAGPVTIHIYPGEYEEEFPLIVPERVTIRGHDLRNVIIKPTSATNTNNAFEVNQNCMISDVTIKDFYSPGHAFAFADDAVITDRSPYIQNITVITKGSVVSADDPRGFNQGDAGKGALIDGSTINLGSIVFESDDNFSGDYFDSTIPYSASIQQEYEQYIGWTFLDGAAIRTITAFQEGYSNKLRVILDSIQSTSNGETFEATGQLPYDKSMLFHSATFITPGVDAITMKGGARVEWLNSFTYFANRGLYALEEVYPHATVVTLSGGSFGWEEDPYSLGRNGLGEITLYNGKPRFLYSGGLVTKSILWQGSYWEILNSATSTSWRSDSDTLYPWQAENWYPVGGTGTAPTLTPNLNNLRIEVRSIGSANVYGNFGAVADGTDTLMYLISHNFSYIGAGKNKSNDKSLSIENNEIVKINNGVIHFTSTNETGKFRIGNNFFADFETGTTSIDASAIDFSGISQIITRSGDSETFINGSRIDTGNIRISGNTITTIDNELVLTPVTGIFNTDNNPSLILSNGDDTTRTNVEGSIRYNTSTNLFEGYSTGNLSFGGTYSDDRVTSLRAHKTNNTIIFTANSVVAGTLDATKLSLVGLSDGDVLFDNNLITTTESNSNLELRRNGTGIIEAFDIDLRDKNIINTSNNTLVLGAVGEGYVKFDSTTGLVIPWGNTTSRPPSPEVGDTRWNTSDEQLETWNGTEWQRSAGTGEDVGTADVNELLDLYTIVLG